MAAFAIKWLDKKWLHVPNNGMRLRDWRIAGGLTLAACAERLGMGHARNYQKYETGENRPDAPMVQRILKISGGAVTLDDLHQQRLEWIRQAKPEMLADFPEVLRLEVPEAAE